MVRLMTLNLWGYNEWTERKGALLSLINNLEPDIIALQEVRLDLSQSSTSQATSLADDASFTYSIYTPTYRTGQNPRAELLLNGYSHGLAILSKFPITSSESYHLSQGADFKEPCSALFASVSMNGDKLDLCNVHFGNTDQESSLHLEELSQLCQLREVRPIIMGDFNIFNLNDSVEDTLFKDYFLSSSEQNYISIPKDNGTLDYIAIPRPYAFETVICPEDRVSDHRAVFAEISRAGTKL